MSFNVPNDAQDISFIYSSLDVSTDNQFYCNFNVNVANAGVQDKTKLVELLMDAIEAYRLHINSINTVDNYPADDSVYVTWVVPGADTYEL